MEKPIRIDELVSPCLTRPRGHEAFEKLLPFLTAGQPIEIVLGAATSVSASCLDGLVERLIESHYLDHVTFVVEDNDQRILRKLGKVAWQHRAAALLYRLSQESERRRVTAIATEEEPAQFEIHKGGPTDGPRGAAPFHAKGRS